MRIPAYIFQAYMVCPREAWFELHSIHSDQDFELLALGRLVHQESYKRMRKELFIDNLLKVDLFRGELVAEVKKSSRHVEGARMQLAYYLYYLKHQKGLELRGVLLFPKEKRTEVVELTSELEGRVERIMGELERLLTLEKPPPAIRTRYCKSCAFQEMCWA